jgi:hypothetical protein
MKWFKKIVIQILEELLKRVSLLENLLNSDLIDLAWRELRSLKNDQGILGTKNCISNTHQRRIEQ